MVVDVAMDFGLVVGIAVLAGTAHADNARAARAVAVTIRFT